MDLYQDLIRQLKQKPLPKQELAKLKIKLCKQYKVKRIPTDIDILLHATQEDAEILRKSSVLQTKPVRIGSGVCPIALMTAPSKCPHGRCTFCPGGPGSVFGDVPQSYTGKEPCTMRGIRNHYDAYFQVMNRLEQYVVLGNIPQKCDIIVMGGTFPATSKEYQEEFIRDTFLAMNDFSALFFNDGELGIQFFKEFFLLPAAVKDEERVKHVHTRLLELKEKNRSKTLEQVKKENDLQSNVKCIGLTIETKPDWGFKEHGIEMLKLGCTRVELGVQTLSDETLRATHRGHTLADTKRSIQELRDLGFKLNFHIMPGLPKATKESDIAMFKELFTNQDYMPDMIKIYPCLVMPGTPLEIQYKQGKFRPITTKEAAELIALATPSIPTWCRVMRVQRDIPTYRTTAGVDRTNLRQYVDEARKKLGVECKCIRCREVKQEKVTGKIVYSVDSYEASHGTEFFISAECKQGLIGFCRLRFVFKSLLEEFTKNSAIIRELHVYGQAVQIGKKGDVQHMGVGKQLIGQAEKIAKGNEKDKLLVIAGVGARGYFRKLGYELEGQYMIKLLK